MENGRENGSDRRWNAKMRGRVMRQTDAMGRNNKKVMMGEE